MFIISEFTNGKSTRYYANDITTAADIILGITGKKNDYIDAIKAMSDMKFGDKYISSAYVINCIEAGLEVIDVIEAFTFDLIGDRNE